MFDLNKFSRSILLLFISISININYIYSQGRGRMLDIDEEEDALDPNALTIVTAGLVIAGFIFYYSYEFWKNKFDSSKEEASVGGCLFGGFMVVFAYLLYVFIFCM